MRLEACSLVDRHRAHFYAARQGVADYELMSTPAHWDAAYGRRATEDLGWYEPVPSTLDLVRRYSGTTDRVIDVGGGDSGLARELVALGYGHITILDVSNEALKRSRTRLAFAAQRADWVEADVTDWIPTSTWDVWHDRAVFHFLTTGTSREAYKRAARKALVPGGRLIVATFSPDGPKQCAGLPVERYDTETLVETFEPEFQAIEVAPLPPRDTSVGDQRPYVAAVLRPRVGIRTSYV